MTEKTPLKMIIEFEPNKCLASYPPLWQVTYCISGYEPKGSTYLHPSRVATASKGGIKPTTVNMTYIQLKSFLEEYGYETDNIPELQKFGIYTDNMTENKGL